jgi:NAD dependent epimerase/dehydratase family enzyme
VLRYGAFYGPDTGMLDAAQIEQIRSRRVPLIGGGTAWWSFLHINDAAEATALAVERGGGTHNIVDDDPARCTNGFPRPPLCSAQSRRSACRRGLPALQPASISSS